MRLFFSVPILNRLLMSLKNQDNTNRKSFALNKHIHNIHVCVFMRTSLCGLWHRHFIAPDTGICAPFPLAIVVAYRACDPPKPDEIYCYYALSVVAMAVINAMEEMYLFDWLRDKRTS